MNEVSLFSSDLLELICAKVAYNRRVARDELVADGYTNWSTVENNPAGQQYVIEQLRGGVLADDAWASMPLKELAAEIERKRASLLERRQLLTYFARANQRQNDDHAGPVADKYSSRHEWWLSLAVDDGGHRPWQFEFETNGRLQELVVEDDGGHWSWCETVSDDARELQFVELKLEAATASEIAAAETAATVDFAATARDDDRPPGMSLPEVDLQLCQVRYNGACYSVTSEGARLCQLMYEA